jgi:hypothetical protein
LSPVLDSREANVHRHYKRCATVSSRSNRGHRSSSQRTVRWIAVVEKKIAYSLPDGAKPTC